MKDTINFMINDTISDLDNRDRVGLVVDHAPDDDLYLVSWAGEDVRTWIDGGRLILVDDDGTGRSGFSRRGRGG